MPQVLTTHVAEKPTQNATHRLRPRGSEQPATERLESHGYLLTKDEIGRFSGDFRRVFLKDFYVLTQSFVLLPNPLIFLKKNFEPA
jgi:hypothetical protein